MASRYFLALRLALPLGVCLATPTLAQRAPFRPPAVPLVTFDPYLSIWSEADRLTDDVTRHWTHRPHPLAAMVKVDGKPYRLMGSEPKGVPPLPQVGLQVTPTRTVYRFANAEIKVAMTFMTPALPDDLDVLTRPLTYLTWTLQSSDGRKHTVALFDSTSSLLSVNTPDQPVVCSRERFGDLVALKAGTAAQTYLRPAGDDARIDWGYAYAVASGKEATGKIGKSSALQGEFAGAAAESSDEPALAFTFDLGRVGSQAVSRHMMIGYDEIVSIEYFGRQLSPYWRRNGATPGELFVKAEHDYQGLVRRCQAFDDRLTADLATAGGPEYAQVAALCYRECLAACGIAADGRGQPLLFTKENTSNGDIATVDVIFPMAPIFILLCPSLAKASLVPVFDYAASPHWKFPNAPHDLGTYPQAFGRDDGGEGMPVEESGNMIILTDAIAHAEGNAGFASKWWPQLTQWAKYLEQYGLDPENQLCTDDFMGHLAHNANLSVKAIVALAAYGDLCAMRGNPAVARRYREMAKADARHWMQVADAGDHSLLAFDKPNTWSQKYNLVWDRLLGLNVFTPSVARREIEFYKTVMQPYGLPLDSRTKLTKTDWSIWSATMAESLTDFESFIRPIYRYLNETSARDPIADSYVTNRVSSGGMHARPVVGGFFIRMLAEPRVWKKWAALDRAKVGPWAPFPAPPKIEPIVPDSRNHPVVWRYTTLRPKTGWTDPAFDDSLWSSGPGGFGTAGTPNGVFATRWDTPDIWLRRTVTLPKRDLSGLRLIVYHDEDVQIYVDGVLALDEAGYQNEYRAFPIRRDALGKLKPGAKITLAVHCRQTAGGQGIDVGLARVTYPDR